MARHKWASVSIAAIVVSTIAGGATAQDDPNAATRANQMAYEASMKCFVVDTRLSALRKRAGDDAKSTYYDDRSKAAFDTAVALGQKIGLEKDEIERDFNVVQVRELPELLRDDGYMRSAIATCKALGLT
jgi:hypothetical protein